MTKNDINFKRILIIVFIIVLAFFCVLINNIYNKNEKSYSLENIPEYISRPYVVINNNYPNFDEKDFSTESFEKYSELDNLGRCGVAFANLSKETMPNPGEIRKSLDKITPSGWQITSYDDLNLKSLYNKCHLIAFSLSAENLNEKNIITGTRYFNVSGMLPFELKVLNYLKTNNEKHVLYRVTPIFEGENKLASGVTIEIASVEDKGKSLHYYVYIYNVQPGVTIYYSTGESQLTKG